MTIPEEKIKQLAEDIVEDMDMDALIQYANQCMIDWLKQLDDELFIEQWENHFDEDYPGTE